MNTSIISGTRDLQNYGLVKGNKHMNPIKANLLRILGQFTVGGLQWLFIVLTTKEIHTLQTDKVMKFTDILEKFWLSEHMNLFFLQDAKARHITIKESCTHNQKSKTHGALS